MSTFNEDLHKLIETKLKKSNPELNQDEISKLRADFNEKYSLEMQNIMFEIYDEFCPDDEIRPIAEYLAADYIEKEGSIDADFDHGVKVQLDDFSFSEGRLVLLPDPARIILQDPKTSHREVLWQAA